MSSVEIEFPPRSDYVSFVRLVVAAVAELAPALSPARVDDLRVVVSEATTNALQAHARAGAAGAVRVSCERSADQVRVVVRDDGAGFDSDCVPALPAPESAERLKHESGLGLSIIRALCNESHIDSGPNGTQITLLLREPAPSGEPGADEAEAPGTAPALDYVFGR